jgi:hypothetical protein
MWKKSRPQVLTSKVLTTIPLLEIGPVLLEYRDCGATSGSPHLAMESILRSTICLSTHQDEASATETINRFLETYQEGQIKTLEDILIFIDSMRAKDKVMPSPVIEQSVGEMAA